MRGKHGDRRMAHLRLRVGARLQGAACLLGVITASGESRRGQNPRLSPVTVTSSIFRGRASSSMRHVLSRSAQYPDSEKSWTGFLCSAVQVKRAKHREVQGHTAGGAERGLAPASAFLLQGGLAPHQGSLTCSVFTLHLGPPPPFTNLVHLGNAPCVHFFIH